MRDSLWLGATALLIAIMALGLGIAALVLALDDDDPRFLDRRFSSAVTPNGPGAPADPTYEFDRAFPFPVPERPNDALPDGSPATSRPLLGVTVGASESAEGVQIETVLPGGPAAEAGLEIGDVVTSVDGEAVDGPLALVAAIGAKAPGDDVTLSVTRDGETLELDATLGEQPGATPRFQFQTPDGPSPFERLPFGQGDGLDVFRDGFGFGDF